MARIVGEAGVKVVPDSSDFTNQAQDQIGPGLNNMTSESGVIGSFVKRVGLMIAGAFAIDAVKDFAVSSVTAFADVERGMNEVFTLLPDISDEAMGKMTDQVKGFSDEFAVLPQEVIPALYQSLSAGVPPGNVFDFLEVAQQAALGGVTDLTTAVDGISSVVNAYGTDVISAGQASDLMFTAVRLGKTTFDELSASLFNVTPTASALGVEFDNVTAALAVMTAQGTPTSVATTQMRALLTELGREGTKVSDIFSGLSGGSLQEFIAGGGDLNNALQLLVDESDRTGVALQDMFGSVEAGGAALQLTNGTAFFDALTQMQDSAGATEAAYDQMDQGTGRALDRLKVKFELFKVEAGEWLAPIVESAANWIAGVAPAVIDSVGQVIGFIVGNVTRLTSSTEFRDYISDLVGGFEDLYVQVSALVVDVWPVLEAALSFAATTLLPLLVDWWLLQAEAVAQVAGTIADIIGWFRRNEDVALALGVAVGVLAVGWGAYRGVMLAIDATNKIVAASQAALNLVMSANPIAIVVIALAALAAGLVVAYNRSETFRDIVNETWSVLQAVMQTGIEWVQAFIDFLVEDVYPAVESFIDDTVAYFSKIAEIIADVVGIVVDLFQGDWADAWSGMQELVRDMVDAAIAWFRLIPERILNLIVDVVAALAQLGIDMHVALVDAVVGMVDDVVDLVASLPGRWLDLQLELLGAAVGLGELIVDGMLAGLASLGQALVDLLHEAWDKLVDAFNAINPINLVDKIPGAGIAKGAVGAVTGLFHGDGGHMDAGQLGIVGDKGQPEWWVPDQPGTVVPISGDTIGLGGIVFQSGAIVVNWSGGSQAQAQQVADDIASRVAALMARERARMQERIVG